MHLEARDIKLAYCEGFDQDENDFRHSIYESKNGHKATVLKKESLAPEYVAIICQDLNIDVPVAVVDILNK